MKKIAILSLAAALMLPTFAFVAVKDAEAACSHNGFIHSRGNCARSYKNSFAFSSGRFDFDDDRFDRIRELLELIEELRALLRNRDTDTNRSDIDVVTAHATDISEDEAQLHGSLDLRNEDSAEAWFEYGTSRFSLEEKTPKQTLDDDEDFEQAVDGLADNTLYYFRAVAEEEDGDIDRGSLLNFRTDDDGNDEDDEKPNADTEEALNITEDEADLNGSVDMNDFENGRVFFIIGEDEDQIDDIEDEFDSYDDVDEDGDDLRKALVDSDLDGSEQYSYDVDSLDSGTEHFFSICVEFEDDDDEELTCGDVEDFTTDTD